MESDTTQQISQLRQRVNEIVTNDGGNADHGQRQKMANKLLHAPTMELRRGEYLSQEDIDALVEEIKYQLDDNMITPPDSRVDACHFSSFTFFPVADKKL